MIAGPSSPKLLKIENSELVRLRTSLKERTSEINNLIRQFQHELLELKKHAIVEIWLHLEKKNATQIMISQKTQHRA